MPIAYRFVLYLYLHKYMCVCVVCACISMHAPYVCNQLDVFFGCGYQLLDMFTDVSAIMQAWFHTFMYTFRSCLQ